MAEPERAPQLEKARQRGRRGGMAVRKSRRRLWRKLQGVAGARWAVEKLRTAPARAKASAGAPRSFRLGGVERLSGNGENQRPRRLRGCNVSGR